MPTRRTIAAGALSAVVALGSQAGAEVDFPDSAIDLPDTLAMTAYGTGSAGYTQMASIGNMLQQEYDTAVRILPGENDVARMTPLKTGRVNLCACGIAAYFGAEGVLMFSGPDWGPQDIRVIATSTASFGLGVAVAGDIGVETPADLEGKRVSYIRGDDALNVGTEAFLAFGGLTWDDVERVEFPGYGRAFEGIVGNQTDTGFTMTVAPPAQQLAASPRGITWPRLDPDNEAGWQRLREVAPYFQPQEVTTVAGEDYGEDSPWIGAGYPYPILVANSDTDDELVRNLVRVLIEEHDKYRDAAPGNEGYALENQNMEWVIPFHEAVVEYYKEIGHWTDEMQAHQDHLVERQRTIRQAWGDYVANNPPQDEEAFKDGWLEARAEALEAKDMAPVFR
ncbi:TAXI family TRAP transporter solute-binding subunit [Aquisalimonas lutea]|uniref:TAXI family TRAP transporter solute-binding subunit n=1 Tax=Aquisalimonas lutea TaxID=1327750 RepID=UPI0025B38ED4|nr:TAXI family TRAP transporter solute-binding subunit [Aquisalimonas lutea]MDN3517778.1 TAXI family TRAP transporter solute-binding subunit [Aquisalimonas lutea]